MMMNTLTAFMMVALALSAWAIPPMINYQGYLTDDSGTPLDTMVSMSFGFFDGPEFGATSLWSETQPAIDVQDGLFHVQLGSVTAFPSDLLDNPDLWLGLAVGSDGEMSPRQQIVSQAMALRVHTINDASGGNITGDVNITDCLNVGSGGEVSGALSSVTGGLNNSSSGDHSHVGGGGWNRARGDYSVVSGGGGAAPDDSNSALGGYCTVSGGASNIASGLGSTVGGGHYNSADNSGTVGGGYWNNATGEAATISGGGANTASGHYAMVPGGYANQASGDYSFAAGREAHAMGNGGFAWADDHAAVFAPGVENTFNARASGGVRFYTNADASVGSRLPAGGSAWVAICDSTKKRNIRLADTKSILEKVGMLPIKQWSYKSQNPSIEHIGPMAQDFWNAFHLGEDSLGISTLDPDGIALAAIQELHKENQELRAEVNELRNLVSKLFESMPNSEKIDVSSTAFNSFNSQNHNLIPKEVQK